MSVVPTIGEIHYPESDGEPVAETEVHLDCLTRRREILKRRHRGQQVYVGANMFADLGVEEYLLYDPLAEYLDPSLQGYRLAENKYKSEAINQKPPHE